MDYFIEWKIHKRKEHWKLLDDTHIQYSYPNKVCPLGILSLSIWYIRMLFLYGPYFTKWRQSYNTNINENSQQWETFWHKLFYRNLQHIYILYVMSCTIHIERNIYVIPLYVIFHFIYRNIHVDVCFLFSPVPFSSECLLLYRLPEL